ncbi:KPN_02809 family neutral zinc metallopeptidase [Chitinophaga nivalis]|uniref:Neutral zinc metallopeptidase n=1 Tax=Chitinophaga nivalis TaxID=2991709 RepID=A0ABT3IL12_9BACT|nr:neutral zinc metallopeptidase [Chitinophaga nivalis]MCW3465652.1 neutral zinc metallopeptidase [Chitinophaga nivalis]MCW3484657.1 neutral zinc metallopeptidase [Chitinophaga nivalis]
MRLDDERMSDNVERRSGGGGMRKIGIGGGIGGVIIIVLALLFKQDPQQVMQAVQQVQGPGGGEESVSQVTKENASAIEIFSSKILASTEDVWKQEFERLQLNYEKPKMVLFTDATTSGCGAAESAMGPFYCPADARVYLDVSFFNELEQRFGVKGEFARAYVIAHEVGHHVQNLLGISRKVQSMRGRLSETEYNKLSVKLELQADFLAGLWANHAEKTRNIIVPGDIQSGLNAASAVGDDKLQEAGTGRVVPDAFTHGTSEQRMFWFKKGYETGDFRQGDTGIGLGGR